MPLLDVAAPWPELGTDAYYGLAGTIVQTIAPHTESDPVAVLVQLLVMVGNAMGRAPYFPVEADQHHMNLFACLVGATSKGRKGTSAGYPKRLLTAIDPAWSERLMGGLSSGEGVIWHVRDAIHGQNKQGEDVCLDAGVDDKRLCILETEFARALVKTGQDGNNLSAVLREAWDRGDLRTLVSGRQKAPVSASNAHVSVIAHITVEELQRLLTDTEAANGFGNRFLWLCVRRSQLLPRGGKYPEEALRPLRQDLTQAVFHARTVAQMQRTPGAETRWAVIYTALAEEHPGLLGAITARAEAQVLRLSCLYALLDRTDTIDVPHLDAAYTLWRYCEASARYIFGTLLGEPLADDIYRMLKLAGAEGMTRTAISNDLGRNYTSTAIQIALAHLARGGLAHHTTEKTSGRSAERWFEHGHQYELNELDEKSSHRDPINSFNSFNSYTEHTQTSFQDLTAQVLWCPSCQRAQAVRRKGIFYLCEVCSVPLRQTTRAAASSMRNGTAQPSEDVCRHTETSQEGDEVVCCACGTRVF